MSIKLTTSPPVRVNSVALLGAVAGMIIQIIAGVTYPTVPPGVVILVATAILVVLVPWPGIRILGVLAPLFILIGGVISSTGRTNVSHPGHVGVFTGTVIQFGGLAIAVVAGFAALAEWRAVRARRITYPITYP